MTALKHDNVYADATSHITKGRLLFHQKSAHGNDGTRANNRLLRNLSRVSDTIFCTTAKRVNAVGEISVCKDKNIKFKRIFTRWYITSFEPES